MTLLAPFHIILPLRPFTPFLVLATLTLDSQRTFCGPSWESMPCPKSFLIPVKVDKPFPAQHFLLAMNTNRNRTAHNTNYPSPSALPADPSQADNFNRDTLILQLHQQTSSLPTQWQNLILTTPGSFFDSLTELTRSLYNLTPKADMISSVEYCMPAWH